jgi:hypothetical protein
MGSGNSSVWNSDVTPKEKRDNANWESIHDIKGNK